MLAVVDDHVNDYGNDNDDELILWNHSQREFH